MADLLSLFDGGFNAAGAGSSTQDGSPSIVDPENDLLLRLSSGSDGVTLLVDYSDFANFVTFNSANSLVTITADKILNEYPYGGTVFDLQGFMDSLDGYQRYFLAGWPSWSGHLRLNPAVSSSYITVNDFGVDGSAARSSFLSPGTGSISFQSWIDVPVLTGSNDAMVVIQKLAANGSDGLTVYLTGTNVVFRIASGSSTVEVSGVPAANPAFFSAVCDRTTATGSVSLLLGTSGTYPTVASSATLPFSGRLDLGSGSFSIASGNLSGKNVVAFTGSIDDVSVWSVPRGASELSSSFNRKVFAQPGLTAIWRFNGSSKATPASYSSVVRDSSGHRLDGKIQRFFSGSRGSGSLIPGDIPDPILSVDDPNVFSYVVSAQQSGTDYDKTNPSLFTNLFPAAFSEGQSGEVFQNFALAIARHFDRIKLAIDQMINFNRVRHGDYDQAPDELLEQLGEFFGFQLDGSFADADTLRYFLGRSVLAGPQGNVGLDQKLDQIKFQFWRRILRDLPYIYKTKGTAESVNSLLNIYGVNSGFVRLKEYARKTEARPSLERVVSKKSVYALQIFSGSTVSFTSSPVSVTGSMFVTFSAMTLSANVSASMSLALSPAPAVMFT